MPNCGASGKFLSPAGAAACSVCPSKFHKVCLGLTEKAQMSKGWLCPNCANKSQRGGDNSQTPVKNICGDSDTEAAPSGPEAGRPISVSNVNEQPEVAEVSEFRREFAGYMAEICEFRKEMASLRDSLTTITSRLDLVQQRVEALEKIPKKVAELEGTISQLKQELNYRDQEALLADLEIGQLPEEKGEGVVQAVTVLAARIDVKLEDQDVVFAERVGPPPAEVGGRARRVVVRLSRRHLRDELLRAARVRRSLAAPDGSTCSVRQRATDPTEPSAISPCARGVPSVALALFLEEAWSNIRSAR
ncbi:unnamed protein product [Diatraea saccharalis]|uniref:PHD-type domain-containing protein n=1 Tax=Diatraea saccharalis TaxID=40085 RepID=A0A9N9R6D0_9NEOP|nr:unnamed protein product [Diatraea saccharalis]